MKVSDLVSKDFKAEYFVYEGVQNMVFTVRDNGKCRELWLDFSKVQTDLDGSEYEFTIDRLLDKLNYHCHSHCDEYDDYISKVEDYNAYAPGHYYK